MNNQNLPIHEKASELVAEFSKYNQDRQNAAILSSTVGYLAGLMTWGFYRAVQGTGFAKENIHGYRASPPPSEHRDHDQEATNALFAAVVGFLTIGASVMGKLTLGQAGVFGGLSLVALSMGYDGYINGFVGMREGYNRGLRPQIALNS